MKKLYFRKRYLAIFLPYLILTTATMMYIFLGFVFQIIDFSLDAIFILSLLNMLFALAILIYVYIDQKRYQK